MLSVGSKLLYPSITSFDTRQRASPIMVSQIIHLVFLLFGFLQNVESCGKCTRPWVDFNRHCYMYVDSTLTFSEAEEFCLNASRAGRTAHLASITTAEENEFIYNLTRPYATGIWIGYKASALTGNMTYSWLDGSPSIFTAWVNDTITYQEGDDCTIFRTKRAFWNPSGCGKRKQFVCKVLQRNAVLGKALNDSGMYTSSTKHILLICLLQWLSINSVN